MATKSKRKKSSIVEEVRRKQIVETAITTLASRGFGKTTLSDIAREAGVSTGVITYHFDNKDELIELIIKTLFEDMNSYIIPKVEKEESYAKRMTAYIETSMEFMAKHRDHCTALVYSFVAMNSEAEKQRITADAYRRIRHYLTRILEEGQKGGEFRTCSAKTLAQLIMASIEGVMIQWVLDEDEVDLARCAKELASMIERQTAAAEPARF